MKPSIPAQMVLLCVGCSCLSAACETDVIIADFVGGEGGMSAGGAKNETPPVRPTFGPPRRIDELSTADSKDQDPTLTGDLLEIYFFSERSGNAEIWNSRRTAVDGVWDPPTQVVELSSPELDINPAVSRDGLRLWFHSMREPDGIWVTERESRADAWGPPTPIAVFQGEIAPGPNITETRIAISVHGGDDLLREVHEATRPTSSDPWGETVELAGINSERDDSTPFLFDDGREILFSSARTGAGDIYWTYRATFDDPVTTPEPLSELNTPDALETHPHLSPDGTRIFFGSSRSGVADLYEAVRLSL